MIGVSKLDKLTNTLVEKAKKLGKTIVLPETEDEEYLKQQN